jgi:2-hydroxychromene-2-carboxylate isomerase
LVAPHYELDFPTDAQPLSRAAVSRVERLLAGLTEDPRFLEVALQAGRALWQADSEALDRVVERVPSASDSEVAAALASGNELRMRRRHYSGGMFWYAGEWYWGVDRLHHLERRLIRLGASRGVATTPRFDRPPLDPGTVQNDGRLSLEIFPSLRSPYTAMIFDRSMQLAESVGVPVTIRPVMPMVMRGVPAPTAKGLYIMLDTLREAEHIGAPFGNMYDPIGRAVEQGFALWPFARDKGRGREFLSAFLKAAFVDGRPTGTEEGLRRVTEEAGLSFDEARPMLEDEGWREELENNRRTMYDELGLWGVPSYRLRGPANEPDLCVWGQDRLWLVAAEIRRRLRSA